MASSEKTYKRLPGTGRQIQMLTYLWLGPDHLLWVESTGFSERYKRFYYKDIQSITIQRTNLYLILNLVLGGLALLFFLFAAVSSDIWQGFWIVFGVIDLVVFICHLILGPTCACFLHTAVQKEKLRSLVRLRTARKALQRLRPLVESAQGQLDRDTLLAQLAPEPIAPTPDHSDPAATEPLPLTPSNPGP